MKIVEYIGLDTSHVKAGYQFNPKLLVRTRQGDDERWTPIYAALNLPLINEFARDGDWESVSERLGEYLVMAGLPERTIPIAAERALARQDALNRERETREAAARAALERNWHEQPAAAAQTLSVTDPKWGTKEAMRREIERLRREIEERKKH